MPLRECTEAHTHREYQAATAWLNGEMNHPTVDQHYMMRIAQRIQQSNAKQPNKVDLKHQMLSFITGKKQTKKAITKDQTIERSKAGWFGGLGINRNKK